MVISVLWLLCHRRLFFMGAKLVFTSSRLKFCQGRGAMDLQLLIYIAIFNYNLVNLLAALLIKMVISTGNGARFQQCIFRSLFLVFQYLNCPRLVSVISMPRDLFKMTFLLKRQKAMCKGETNL